ncbi:hypothetical protein [Hymenobacter sp. BT491]|uniref:hypothetical protein n=1 Tax=Hymenobacter sp. BT491 TaxID=2766779 RepID=UPI001653EB97|nr:hypothetical protein [Hymenobacter sp. BT491]MBC6989973.1 hypothetical protein [Hymenobacter sp. BT491]
MLFIGKVLNRLLIPDVIGLHAVGGKVSPALEEIRAGIDAIAASGPREVYEHQPLVREVEENIIGTLMFANGGKGDAIYGMARGELVAQFVLDAGVLTFR